MAVGETPEGPIKTTMPARDSMLRSAISFSIGLAMFLLAIWVLHRWVSKVRTDDLWAELLHISATSACMATVFTFASFGALIGYEYYACHYVGRPLKLRTTALISFLTQSIAHAVGFAIFIGATIRYKLYSPHGLSLLDVAKVQVFFTTTFGLGCVTLIGGSFLIEPAALVHGTGVPGVVWRLIGAAMLLAVGAILVWGALFHRPIKMFGRAIILPSAKVVLIQIMLGIADLGFVAAALYVLLPASLGLDYFHTLGIFVAAISLGLISHVPGSLGVFETTVLYLVSPAEAEVPAVLGALIAFRAIYYMLPLILGAGTFGVLELRRMMSGRPSPRPTRPANQAAR